MKTESNVTAPTQFLQVSNETYAYRRFGNGSDIPLLFLQHTGTLDNGDPAVTDPLATGREVILLENAGVGLAEGESKYDDLERWLATGPVITVPTITLEGDVNGAPHPDPSSYAKKFSGNYAHRLIKGA